MRSLPQTCASSIKKLLALFSLMSGGEKIVECVPNFSEGRRADVVEAIAAAVRETEGCSLLDVAPGDSTNRTVYTFVGRPESVLEGALAAARVAFKLIDMTKQKGEHPRLGALDVCPFIPVANVTMEECAELSRRFGCRLATELSVPVYLYEYAVAVGNDRDYRRTLPQIREGEYERLRNKIQKPEWAPDFGPADYIPSWGATVTGARSFLIAYNVNLLATKEQAHRIALNIREQGRGPSQPGRLKAVKAIGWYLDDQDLAQVSINICDFQTTPLHVVFEEVCKDAKVPSGQLQGRSSPLFISQSVPVQSLRQDIGPRWRSASVGAALGTMVGLLTYGKKKYEDLDDVMRKTIGPLHDNLQKMMPLVDRDSEAFAEYMMASKLPQKTEEEKKIRDEKMAAGMRTAVSVPLSLVRAGCECWPHLLTLATHGNIQTMCDLRVSWNRISLTTSDADFAASVREEGERLAGYSTKLCASVLASIDEREKEGS
ncbi:Formimidoyltransferase-cyclodeaminase [Geodia barretti]|uniref:Formimidoyltransferase-cyclodeaminase n=1 Tax=Geodia barretti TaxID=519541 RepID=A0AA35TAZ7_GEOBA|nr:Formimidoyltransferase-cyclodeaminase [Geodia barretti]